MQTVILAGGLGTRLYPVLRDVPKPMAPVGDKCFLELLLELLKGQGLTDFIFCVSHLAAKIMNYFEDGSRFGVSIRYSLEEKPLGTGGAIGLLKNVISETFCVLNGDTYQELDFQKCIQQHQDSSMIGTMTIANAKNSARYGQVMTDPAGYVTGFREKGAGTASGLINSGLYVLEPAVFDYLPAKKFVSFEQDVLTAVLKDNKKIGTYRGVSNFYDIGVPEDYFSFCEWIKSKSITGGGIEL